LSDDHRHNSEGSAAPRDARTDDARADDARTDDARADGARADDARANGARADEAPVRATAGRIPLGIMLALALLGIGAAVELTVVYHQANVDLGHESHCKLSAEWDCDNVARSQYASLASVPVSLWGVIGYGFMAFLLGWGLSGRGPRHWPLGLLSVLVLLSVAMSAYLMYASFVVLQKKCMWCTVLYGVNGGLLVGLVATLVARRIGPIRAFRQDFGWLLDRLHVLGALSAAALGLAAIALVWGPRLGHAEREREPVSMESLIKNPTPAARRGATNPDDARRQAGARPLPPLPQGPPEWVKALVEPSTPGIGPKNADLYIVEFSDYECPFCQISNRQMEKVLAKYGERIRLYHRHFPLDKSCFRQMKRQMHPHACFAAKAAICAHKQGKFWDFHDKLFRLGKSISRESIRALAKKLGLDTKKLEACIAADSTEEQIQEDIRAAMALKIRGTPTFLMGGPLLDRFKPPGISLEMFDELFKAVDKAKRDYAARRAASLRRAPPRGARAPAMAPTPARSSAKGETGMAPSTSRAAGRGGAARRATGMGAAAKDAAKADDSATARSGSSPSDRDAPPGAPPTRATVP
jgi:protein-disulfide isomerase/uncharacterized membrane protein